jgi:hypothetical protein
MLCLALMSPSLARADGGPSAAEQAEARTRYKKGLELYDEGAFDAALIELQRAHELSPSYKILYNVALVYLQLNDYAGSLKNFKRYLADGGKKVDGKRKAEIEKEIAKLQARVATVTLEVNVEGATVSVDDLEVGQTPLEAPLVLNAGKRRLSLQKRGYSPFAKVVVLAGGDEKKLSFELKSTAASAAATGKAGAKGPLGKGPEPKADEGPTRPVPWLWWGVTGGLAAGTAVAGVLTLGAQKDLDDKKATPAGKSTLDDAATKTRTLAVVTDVLLVGTLAAGGYATYLTFFAPPEEPKKDKKASLRLGIGPGSVSMAGSF